MIAKVQSASAQAAYTHPVEPYTHTGVTQATYGEQTELRKWDCVLQELRKLRYLHNDWDGEGSDAPPHQLIETAIRFVGVLQSSRFEIPTTAVASRAGTVLFGWHEGSRYQEIEVVAPNRLEWMIIDENGDSTHGELSLPDETRAAATNAFPEHRCFGPGATVYDRSTTPLSSPQKLPV